jgi:hypothetical protein
MHYLIIQTVASVFGATINQLCGFVARRDGKPRLCMNYISRVGAIYSLIVREEEILKEGKRRAGDVEVETDHRDEDIELVVPPVFDKCKKVLDGGEQIVTGKLFVICLREG